MVTCPLNNPVSFTVDDGCLSLCYLFLFLSLSSDFFIHCLALAYNTNLTSVPIVSIRISAWELILFHCDWPFLGQKRAPGDGTGKLKFTS